MKARIFVAVSLTAAFGALPLLAEQPTPASKIVIAVRALDESVDPSILEIIELATSLRLERQGLKSRVMERTEAAAIREPETFLGGESGGARFLLLAEASKRGQDLALHLAWFDGDTGQWIAELERSGKLDMRVDDMIFRALDELFDGVKSTKPLELRAAPTEAAGASAEPSEASAIMPALSGAAPDAASNEAVVPPPSQPPLESGAVREAAAPRGLQLDFDAGPFLIGGDLGPFFEASGGIDGRIVWHFPGREASFGLGLTVSCYAFTAKGPLESSLGLLAPLALELRLGAAGELLMPFLHLSGGAALLYLRTELYGDRFGVLPFAAAGLGLTMLLGPGFGVMFDLSYMVFLDGGDLIMGFKPTIGIAIPLGSQP